MCCGKKRTGEKQKNRRRLKSPAVWGDYEILLTDNLLTYLSLMVCTDSHPAKWMRTDVETQIIHNATIPITVPLQISDIFN